jgi:hypothetical protein
MCLEWGVMLCVCVWGQNKNDNAVRRPELAGERKKKKETKITEEKLKFMVFNIFFIRLASQLLRNTKVGCHCHEVKSYQRKEFQPFP